MSTHRPRWTFLSNHGLVLVCLATDPGMRMRDIAERVGITERAVQSIVADLVAERYVERERVGRRNHYKVNQHGRLRHPLQQGHEVGELLAVLAAAGPDVGAAAAPAGVRSDVG